MADRTSATPDLWITGLGAQYPCHLLGPKNLDEIARRFHDIETPGLKRLLKINRSTGIETRSAIDSYETGFATDVDLPTLADMDVLFRTMGVGLTTKACKKAIRDWGGNPREITHTVAVTCTNQGNPGYDFLVNQELGLPSTVDRTLLHGVGCAGGLAIMRVAAQLACGATMRGRPARILAFACELCTPNVRYELDAAARCTETAGLGIAGTIFSDGAAAFVLCNEYGMKEGIEPKFQLLDWGNALIPDTTEHLAFFAEPFGYRTILSKAVPSSTKDAIRPMFDELLSSVCAKIQDDTLDVADFDWALHPGGQTIIDGAAMVLSLNEEQLRATREIYRTRGNSSSPTVLIVLDKLRSMGRGKDLVVATSFGPGLTIEMSMLRRCREDESYVDSGIDLGGSISNENV